MTEGKPWADLLQRLTDWQIVTEKGSETTDTLLGVWCTRREDNLDDADDDEEDDGYDDENSDGVMAVVRLLGPRDGRQAGGRAGGLAGKQTVSPGGIPALSGCHYLSVSISPSTGLAYR